MSAISADASARDALGGVDAAHASAAFVETPPPPPSSRRFEFPAAFPPPPPRRSANGAAFASLAAHASASRAVPPAAGLPPAFASFRKFCSAASRESMSAISADASARDALGGVDAAHASAAFVETPPPPPSSRRFEFPAAFPPPPPRRSANGAAFAPLAAPLARPPSSPSFSFAAKSFSRCLTSRKIRPGDAPGPPPPPPPPPPAALLAALPPGPARRPRASPGDGERYRAGLAPRLFGHLLL